MKDNERLTKVRQLLKKGQEKGLTEGEKEEFNTLLDRTKFDLYLPSGSATYNSLYVAEKKGKLAFFDHEVIANDDHFVCYLILCRDIKLGLPQEIVFQGKQSKCGKIKKCKNKKKNCCKPAA